MHILGLFGGRSSRSGLLVVLALSLILTALPTAALAAPAANDRYHKVSHGETLSQIAKHYGVPVWVLAKANDIANPNIIYAGQHLYIPPAGTGYGDDYKHKPDDGYGHDKGCGQDCYGWKDDGYGHDKDCGQDCYGWKDDGYGHDKDCGQDCYGWKDDGHGHDKDCGQDCYGWKDDGYKSVSHHDGYGKCAGWHHVRKGDYLGKIAKWYGANAYTIAKVNGIANPSVIQPGQKLCIPTW